MKVKDLIKLLAVLPPDAVLVKDNPAARDEGLGHWFIPHYLHLVGVFTEKRGNTLCAEFKYSEEDYGWQDDCLSAVEDGRFFTAHNLNKGDFVWARDGMPTKDGTYLCICRHGDSKARYTLEKQVFYAKVNPSGLVREDGQWGFGCEHIPAFSACPSYPVALWSPKSYAPFSHS